MYGDQSDEKEEITGHEPTITKPAINEAFVPLVFEKTSSSDLNKPTVESVTTKELSPPANPLPLVN